MRRAMDRRILILGQDEENLLPLQNELEDNGYHVAWVKTIDEAQEFFVEDEDPIQHLILGDFKVLDGDCLEFYQRIKKEGLPLGYVLSPSYVHMSAEDAEDKGFVALFKKPIDPFKVAKSVSSLIYFQENDGVMRPPRYWSDMVGDFGSELRGAIQNFSRGGFCVTIDQIPGQIGTLQNVMILDPETEEVILEAKAMMRWSYEVPEFDEQKNVIAGFQFEDLSEEASNSIQTILLKSQENRLYPVFRLPEEFKEDEG